MLNRVKRLGALPELRPTLSLYRDTHQRRYRGRTGDVSSTEGNSGACRGRPKFEPTRLAEVQADTSDGYGLRDSSALARKRRKLPDQSLALVPADHDLS